MLEILSNSTLIFALLGGCAAIAVICALVTLIKQSVDETKAAENGTEENCESVADSEEKLIECNCGATCNCTAQGIAETVTADENYAEITVSKKEAAAQKKAEKTAKKEALKNEKEAAKAAKNAEKIAKEVAESELIAEVDSAAVEAEAVEAEVEAEAEAETTQSETVAETSKQSEVTNESEVARNVTTTVENEVAKAEKEKPADTIEVAETFSAPETVADSPAAVAPETEEEKAAEPATAKKPAAKKAAPKKTAAKKPIEATENGENAVEKAPQKKPAKPPVSDDELKAKTLGKYVVKEVADEDFQFELYDNKNKLLFQSVSYSSRAVCEKNIGYFKKNVSDGEFTIEGKTSTGFNFVLTRGMVTCAGVLQKTRPAVENAITAVRNFANTDVVIIEK